ncbi:MAG: hypothetical protein WAN40_00785 [Thermoplasmata archaeon]
MRGELGSIYQADRHAFIESAAARAENSPRPKNPLPDITEPLNPPQVLKHVLKSLRTLSLSIEGTLSLNGQPTWASVGVDGSIATIDKGALPMGLSPGVHSLEIAAFGCLTHFTKASVNSTKTTLWSIQRVRVSTSPSETSLSSLA